MTTWLYDGTFDGFLSCVFDMYWQRKMKIRIRKEQEYLRSVSEDILFMPTNQANADRVWTGLSRKTSAAERAALYYCYLSELPGEEDNMVGFIRYRFELQADTKPDAGNFYVSHIQQLAFKVGLEQQRLESNTSFQLTKDNIWYAVISPDHNVLPLLMEHFKAHYHGQCWLIYDKRRRFGLYHNLRNVETVRLQFCNPPDTRYFRSGNVWSPEEPFYQQIWKVIYKEKPVRDDQQLHLQYVTKHYWKYL